MACVQARSPRRLAHDRPRLRPCPTRSLGRSPSRCPFLLSPSLEELPDEALFHLLRHRAIENLNGHLKAISEAHGEVPTKGEADTARFALGAASVYQLAMLHRHEHARYSETNRGLEALLRAA
jgi:hypothetical protein